ncbi:hypothetical protein H4R99_004828 [Coemansia sp. RSA 1722]|nr:hypothetical protein IWW45_008768 [Coemansia sp. RSA 485]KAJ2596682.1 hypothetical protein H4R99_004828 [Coemansia sp. RSA 1722]
MTLPLGGSANNISNGHTSSSEHQDSQPLSNGNSSSTSNNNGLCRFPGQPQQTSRTCLRKSPYNEEQVVRLIMQELHDRGFVDTLNLLERESGFTLEDEPISRFRASILAGNWSEVEHTLSSIGIDSEENRNAALFAIKKQQFLELLEDRKLKQALLILQNELSTLTQDIPQLHRLSSLLMCPSPEELRTAASWDGSEGRSRFSVLESLQSYISPGKMVPVHRMETLFNQAIEWQSEVCERHVVPADHDLYTDHVCASSVFPPELLITLRGHTDEVWYVAFSPDGRYLASASRDKTCILWSTKDYSLVHKLEGHEGEVSYLSWSPNGKYLLSASTDKTIRLWNVASGECMQTFTGHEETASSCKWLDDEDRFITGSMDQKILIWSTKSNIIKQISSPRVHDMVISLECGLLLAADNRTSIHVYDLSTLTFLYKLEEPTAIMSLALSSDSKYCLTELRNGSLHMWDLETRTRVRDFSGHIQGSYVIRCTFAGLEDRFVATGSEDGTLFVWNRKTGRLLERLKSHTKSINGCAWSDQAAALATAADDKTICIWPAYRGAPSDLISKNKTSQNLASSSTSSADGDDKSMISNAAQ